MPAASCKRAGDNRENMSIYVSNLWWCDNEEVGEGTLVPNLVLSVRNVAERAAFHHTVIAVSSEQHEV